MLYNIKNQGFKPKKLIVLQPLLLNLEPPARTLRLPPVQSPEGSPASPHELLASQQPPTKQPRICHSDVGAFVGSHHDPVSDNDKYRLIEEHFISEPTYKFPKASNGRTFQHKWLSRYQWLRYSEQDDGGYCLPCALFIRPTVNFRSDPAHAR